MSARRRAAFVTAGLLLLLFAVVRYNASTERVTLP